MADITGGLTKRLSFGEVSTYLNATQHVEVEDVIKALKNPSVDGFERALNLLRDATDQRFRGIIDAAEKTSENACGEAELRRLRRHFSSVKNTFLHFEVKDEFIAALGDGLPNGTEEAQLQQLEAEVAQTIEVLRSHKASNASIQEDIEAVISEISYTLDNFANRRETVFTALNHLRQQLAQAEANAGDLQILPDGPNEAACAIALDASVAETRELEARAAQCAAQAAESELALVSERNEISLLRAQLADLEAQAREDAAAGNNNNGPSTSSEDRFASAGRWCEEAAALVSAVSGLVILESSSDTLHVSIRTAYPAIRGVVATATHQLHLHLSPSSTATNTTTTSNVAKAAVVGGELTPSDVDISDIIDIAATEQQRGGAQFVVREVQSRLAGHLHRSAVISEAQQAFPGSIPLLPISCNNNMAGNGSGSGIKVFLGRGVEVEVRFRRSWPIAEGGDELVVSKVTGGNGDEMKMMKKIVEEEGGFKVPRGASMVEAVEMVKREVMTMMMTA